MKITAKIKKNMHKFLSILLCCAMLLSLVPVTALAEDMPPAKAAPKAWIGDQEYETLEAAVNAAESGATITLGEGKYTLYQKGAVTKDKDLTFVGQGPEKTAWGIGATIPDPDKFGTEYNGDYSFDGAGTVTFKNMTLQSSTADYLGFIRADQTVVENCIINGKTFYWGYSSAAFKNTTFNAPTGDYALWTYSSPIMTFDSCTFNTSGKTINVYNEGGTPNITINYKNCTVNSTVSNKTVMNINDTFAKLYTINISGVNTINGEIPVDGIKNGKAEANRTCSKFFEFNGSGGANNKGKTIVNIDGTTVWQNGKMVSHAIDTANDKYTDGYKDNAFDVTCTDWDKLPNGTEVRSVTKTCQYCGYTETTKEKKLSWDVSKSKTATNLDENFESQVTLSLPSAEEELSSDIVFMMDTSDCVGEVMNQVELLIEQLKKAQESTNANIKVGVIAFKGSALSMFDGKLVSVAEASAELQKMAADVAAAEAGKKEAVVLDYLDADDSFINKGSNLHSGLMAAKQMLESDQSVIDSRKHLIAITDGMTYYWNDENNNVYGIYSSSDSNGQNYPSLLFYGWQEAYGIGKGYKLPEDINAENWDDYISATRNKIDDNYTVNIREATEKFNTNYSNVRFSTIDSLANAGYQYINKDNGKKIAHGIERSVIACLDTYQEMIEAGYQCYTINSNYSTDSFPGLFTAKLNEMANQESIIDFSVIQNDILYLLGAGSTIVDEIGNTSEYNFDLVIKQNQCPFRLTVGGVEYTAEAAGENIWNFYAPTDNSATDDAARKADFRVVYENADTEKFTWYINTNISNFANVQLIYSVKLSNPQTVPGTYGTYDASGTMEYDGLYTNNSATLYPVDSRQNSNYLPDTFLKPTVSYTVSNSGGNNGYTLTLTKVDADDNSYTLQGAKFDLYRQGEKDDTKIGSYTTDKAGVINAKVSQSGDYYWLETQSPAGYTLDTTKHATSTATSKRSIVVKNKKTETPSILNSDDHFAYVIGYPDGLIHPDGEITRAETATIFFRLLNEDVRNQNLTKDNSFSDVGKDNWFNTAVSTMSALNIVNGYPNGTFEPNAPITRGEFAAIAARFDSSDADTTADFTDIKGHWAAEEISKAAKNGWVGGYPDGTFKPNQNITRAEAMALINRVLNRNPETADDLLATMAVWPDNMDQSKWCYLDIQEATNSHDYERKANNTEYWTKITQNPDWSALEK